jgi:hypothetical protein
MLHHNLLKVFDSWSYRFQIHKSSVSLELHANPAKLMCNLGVPGVTSGGLADCLNILITQQGFTAGIVLFW